VLARVQLSRQTISKPTAARARTTAAAARTPALEWMVLWPTHPPTALAGRRQPGTAMGRFEAEQERTEAQYRREDTEPDFYETVTVRGGNIVGDRRVRRIV
jgi:hypothetical protein